MDPWAPNAIRRVKRDHTYVRVHMRNRIRAKSLETARRAAVDGLGIAPLLELTCRKELERGELVEVLRGALPDTAPFWALVPLARTRSAAASALLAWFARAHEPPRRDAGRVRGLSSRRRAAPSWGKEVVRGRDSRVFRTFPDLDRIPLASRGTPFGVL